MSGKKSYGASLTTGQVAKLAGVAPRTATKWTDSGVLECYRLPMSKDRRIPREALVRFLRERNFYMPHLMRELGYPVILAVGVDARTLARLRAAMPDDYYELHETWTALGAAEKLAKHLPVVVIIDCAMGLSDATGLIRHVREHGRKYEGGVRLIVLANEDGGGADIKEEGVTVLRKPFDVAMLARLAQQKGVKA